MEQHPQTRCDFGVCPVQGQELDWMILVNPFQLRRLFKSLVGFSAALPNAGPG